MRAAHKDTSGKTGDEGAGDEEALVVNARCTAKSFETSGPSRRSRELLVSIDMFRQRLSLLLANILQFYVAGYTSRPESVSFSSGASHEWIETFSERIKKTSDE